MTRHSNELADALEKAHGLATEADSNVTDDVESVRAANLRHAQFNSICYARIDDILQAMRGASGRAAAALQWACDMFGADVVTNPVERAARLLEEVLELAQTQGLALEQAQRIAARVFERPPGNALKEIGQVGLTFEILAENLRLDADVLTSVEFGRVRNIPREEWQRRHAAKAAQGIARLSEGPR